MFTVLFIGLRFKQTLLTLSTCTALKKLLPPQGQNVIEQCHRWTSAGHLITGSRSGWFWYFFLIFFKINFFLILGWGCSIISVIKNLAGSFGHSRMHIGKNPPRLVNWCMRGSREGGHKNRGPYPSPTPTGALPQHYLSNTGT